jgi:flagellar biosynthesis protein FlhG
MWELDQAKTLREMMETSLTPRRHAGSTMRVISITSGKGGVGKSTVVANLALSLAKKGQKVLLLDGDFGLANLDIMLDVKSSGTLYDVLYKNCSVRDVIVEVVPGVDMIPASSGIMEMTNLGIAEKSKMLDFMQELENFYDVLLIDTGAGINSDVTWLNASASEIIVVATPDPTSITDAYALIKVLNQNCKIKKFKLLVNQAKTDTEALRVYQKITSVADRFLNVGIDFVGHVLWDELMTHAIRQRRPILSAYPNSKVSQNFSQIADTMFGSSERVAADVQSPKFLWKAILGHA